MKRKVINILITASSIFAASACISHASTTTTLIHKGADFASLLKTPTECTSASSCPSGAYFINQNDYSDAKDAAAELYKLGTTIGGSQDGTVAGPATQWSKDRYAILIGSGTYNMVNPKTTWPQPFKIGYYTQITGVAPNREDVIVEPGINSLNDCDESLPWMKLPERCATTGGLNNFWRTLSDLTLNSQNLLKPSNTAASEGTEPEKATTLRFAISQAAPIRNVHFAGLSGIDKNGAAKGVTLCDWDTGGYMTKGDDGKDVYHDRGCGFASGGFVSDSAFSGIVSAGSQQQFYISNSNFESWDAGTWNMVSSNNIGNLRPTGIDANTTTKTNNQWRSSNTEAGYPFTKISDSVSVPHKPRLIYVPKDGDSTAHWEVSLGNPAGTIKNVSHFTIMTPGTYTENDIKDVNTDIDKQDSAGLIIMPGIYNLQEVLHIPDNKVVLGLGLPSLQCNSPSGACMTTANEGVRLAGLTFDAGTKNTDTSKNNILLTVGTKSANDYSANPDVLQDVFCRVARTDSTMASPSTYSCLEVNANNTIGQNLWLWRADHDDQSGKNSDPAQNLVPASIDKGQYGLIVNGNHVTMDALFVEHFQNYQTVWNGKNGQINFYQSEMPYLLPEGDATTPNVTCSTPDTSATSTEMVCPSLYITKNAEGFRGEGLGIYSYFAKQDVKAKAAIEIEKDAKNITIKHAVIRWLNGETESGIDSIVKDASGTYPATSAVNGEKQGYALGSVDIL